MLKKNPEPNRIYILSELEKHAERKNSFGGRYNDVDELRKFRELSTDSSPKCIQNPSSHAFSEFKVINGFKVKEQDSFGDQKYKNEQHGRSRKKYSIVFDAKYVKMIVKRAYRREDLFDAFRSLFQALSTTLLEFESTQIKNDKFDANLVKRRLSMSKFNRKSIDGRVPEHGDRARQVNKVLDSIYVIPCMRMVIDCSNMISFRIMAHDSTKECRCKEPNLLSFIDYTTIFSIYVGLSKFFCWSKIGILKFRPRIIQRIKNNKYLYVYQLVAFQKA